MKILIHRDKREWEPLLNRTVLPGERIGVDGKDMARRLLHAGKPNYRWFPLEAPEPLRIKEITTEPKRRQAAAPVGKRKGARK